MSESNNSGAKLARIIVERQPDGTLVIEQYINGARHRAPIMAGFERVEILDAIARQQRDIDASEARRQRKIEAEEAARHRRVYWTSATRPGQGKDFADKFIGRPPQAERATGPARTAPAEVAVMASEDLL